MRDNWVTNGLKVKYDIHRQGGSKKEINPNESDQSSPQDAMASIMSLSSFG